MWMLWRIRSRSTSYMVLWRTYIMWKKRLIATISTFKKETCLLLLLQPERACVDFASRKLLLTYLHKDADADRNFLHLKNPGMLQWKAIKITFVSFIRHFTTKSENFWFRMTRDSSVAGDGHLDGSKGLNNLISTTKDDVRSALS